MVHQKKKNMPVYERCESTLSNVKLRERFLAIAHEELQTKLRH